MPLPAAVAGELESVVREALTNVAKHAGADARAWVLLEDLGDEVVVSVRDDGVGIAPQRLDDAEREGRMGIARSMRGRVADLGGTIERGDRAGRRRGVGAAGAARGPEVSPEPISVMVVDDHPMWRDGVARDLAERGFDGRGPPRATRTRPCASRGTVRPDVVLMDLNLGSESGVAAIRRITGALPDTRVLVLSASGEHVGRAGGGEGRRVGLPGQVGVGGGARRGGAADRGRRRGVHAGPRGPGARRVPADGRGPGRTGEPSLTQRETEVLRLVAKGLTARQIASRLTLSHRTVENHVQSTLRKLQLHNRVELARYAIEHGLDAEPEGGAQ